MPEDSGDAVSRNGSALASRVDGRVRASSVGKVQAALPALSGGTGIAASTITETVTASVDQSRTSPVEIETRLARLGHAPTRKLTPTSSRGSGSDEFGHRHADAGAGNSGHQPGPGRERASVATHTRGQANGVTAGKHWRQTTKGRLVLLTVALLTLAWIIQLAPPAMAHWAFVEAPLAGAASTVAPGRGRRRGGPHTRTTAADLPIRQRVQCLAEATADHALLVPHRFHPADCPPCADAPHPRPKGQGITCPR